MIICVWQLIGEVFEGWVKFGEKEFLAVLEAYVEQYNVTSNLIGDGTIYHPDTSFSKGFFKFDLNFHGYAHSYLYEKETYKGYFVYSHRKGYGICEYKDGEIYKGHWASNKRQMFGTIKYASGAVFKGI